jgi:hypothetical protein
MAFVDLCTVYEFRTILVHLYSELRRDE